MAPRSVAPKAIKDYFYETRVLMGRDFTVKRFAAETLEGAVDPVMLGYIEKGKRFPNEALVRRLAAVRREPAAALLAVLYRDRILHAFGRELRRAVGRGVRVRLLVTRHTDVPAMRWAARGLYGRLLRSGIEVYEYLPAILHTKLAIADDTLLVGSANLDLRSDRLNHEITAVVRDPVLAATARREFESDLSRAERVDLAVWRNRSPLDKMREFFSYWLIARADIFLSRVELFRTRW